MHEKWISMKMAKDKRRNKREVDQRREMKRVALFVFDAVPPAKQMMINEAAGRLAFRTIQRMGSHT